MGRQYDSRQNSFDWDYHMKLTESDKRAAIIYKKEYLQFRETGVAFDIRNAVADKDNRTLASVDLLLQVASNNLGRRKNTKMGHFWRH